MVEWFAVVWLIGLNIFFWHHVYTEYHANRDELWLQAETFVLAATLPIKVARLAGTDAVAAIPVPVYDVTVTQIDDTWGAPRPGGRGHEGVDVFASRGTPVFAAAPGYVLRAGENTLGGLNVFTIGPGGVRYYYAHLDRTALGMTPGREVTTDTVIGYVGNTGNASTTPPHLHFGMYQDGPSNPYPFLVNRD